MYPSVCSSSNVRCHSSFFKREDSFLSAGTLQAVRRVATLKVLAAARTRRTSSTRRVTQHFTTGHNAGGLRQVGGAELAVQRVYGLRVVRSLRRVLLLAIIVLQGLLVGHVLLLELAQLIAAASLRKHVLTILAASVHVLRRLREHDLLCVRGRGDAARRSRRRASVAIARGSGCTALHLGRLMLTNERAAAGATLRLVRLARAVTHLAHLLRDLSLRLGTIHALAHEHVHQQHLLLIRRDRGCGALAHLLNAMVLQSETGRVSSTRATSTLMGALLAEARVHAALRATRL